MSISPQSKRYVRFIKPEKTVAQVNALQKQSFQKHRSKSMKNIDLKTSTSVQKSYMKTKSIKDEVAAQLQGARATKQKINKGLQFVKLIDNFNQQQRCLDHNNIITLYCMNDKKLLCVYCIYGVNKHRAHKLLPPLEHLQYIAKDVSDLQLNFNEFLFSLEDVISTSKSSSNLFQDIMKKYLAEIQVEYMRKKLQLQQNYEIQKQYVTKTCSELIENSKLISREYEQIKFNIWQCQARYNIDKKLKLNGNLKSQHESGNKNNIQKMQRLQSNNNQQKRQISKSRSSLKIKKQQQQKLRRQQKNHELSVDSEKDYRQIMSKHIILNHVVQQMRKIQPIKIDQKNIQRKIFNKSILKLISHKFQDSNYQTFNKSKNKK